MAIRISRAAAASPASRWARRHKEILDAAAATFAEHGYLGSSTSDIADRLGIKAASLYYYVESKDAALAQICESNIVEFTERLAASVESDKPASEKIRDAIANQLVPLTRRPEAYYTKVFLRHRYQLSDGPRQHVVALSRRYEKMVERIFVDGVASGQLRADLDPGVASFGLIGICNAVIGARTLPRGATIRSLIDDLTRLVTAGVVVTKP